MGMVAEAQQEELSNKSWEELAGCPGIFQEKPLWFLEQLPGFGGPDWRLVVKRSSVPLSFQRGLACAKPHPGCRDPAGSTGSPALPCPWPCV